MCNFAEKEQIYVNDEKCIGCNKCLNNCPVIGAIIGYLVDGNNKIKINTEKCINCGKCIKVCAHKAIDFRDDTKRFFYDLSNGKKLSVIADPLFLISFHKYKKLLGYLKSTGVNIVYNISFGADISIWAYTRTVEKDNLDTMISGNCPSIVNYIQKHQPELMDKLAPIHSPMMCTAIYMKKYANISDDIAFLSPCIAKSDEINDKNTYGYVKYNVTFKGIIEYLKNNHIDINQYEECNFDYTGWDLGFLLSSPGGLMENIEINIKDAWLRNISGPNDSYKYINAYKNNLENNKQMPLVVDILNCTYGCNFGTGVYSKHASSTTTDEVYYKMHRLRSKKKEGENKESGEVEIKYLHDYFNKNLKLEDFRRSYNKNLINNDIIEPTEEEYDKIFIKMNKKTLESRNINCSSCGYGSCRIMAKCIHNDLNVMSNCIDYNKKEVINEHNLLEERNEFFTNISHELRTPLNVIYSVLQMQMKYYDSLSIDDITKYNKIIKQNCLRLIRLVNNIIDLAKIEAGFFKPLLVFENIVNVVENVTLSISPYAENKKMNLIFDTEMEELYLKCDISLIERVMLNLLSNSVKYGKENGTINVMVYKPNLSSVTISVKDDGIGIPEKMQEKIFERFKKVDTSLSRENEGSGIGLSIVKSLVEIHGGTINCISKLNKGTEFIITFPFDNEEHNQSLDIKNYAFYEKTSTEKVDIEFSDIYFQ